MAKEKFYAVKTGRNPGVYKTWDECSKQVNGFPNAVYKSFSTLGEAERFVSAEDSREEPKVRDGEGLSTTDEANMHVSEMIASLKDDEAIAFVDGSYDVVQNKSAFGAIMITKDGDEDRLYNSFTQDMKGEEFMSLRNVAAEAQAAEEAVRWALGCRKKRITIFYDYEGIGKFASGEWTPKNDVTREFVSFLRDSSRLIEIRFEKVLAHSGVEYSDKVDRLAKDALLSRCHKTYADGSVYFVGYGADDWRCVIDYLNSESRGLDENAEDIIISEEEANHHPKLVATLGKCRVTINCYSNNTSYVQGKQTTLFRNIIFTATEMLSTTQNMLDTLNEYLATGTKSVTDDIEEKLRAMLPHYRREDEKLHKLLMQSVRFLSWTEQMDDYTCLLAPLFRAYEYYLHKILGNTMKLQTTRDNMAPNFSYFKEDKASKRFRCTSKKRFVLSTDQLKLLNDLYTEYHNVRHPYSHWSAGLKNSTPLIESYDEATNLIKEGLELIERYYELF